MDEVLAAINGMMGPKKMGLGKQEGITGKADRDIVRLRWLYADRKNGMTSIFFGTFSQDDSILVLSGRYKKSVLDHIFFLYILFFFILGFFIDFVNMVSAENIHDLRQCLIVLCILSFFAIIMFLFTKLSASMGKEDEKNIDAFLERMLECKIKILG